MPKRRKLSSAGLILTSATGKRYGVQLRGPSAKLLTDWDYDALGALLSMAVADCGSWSGVESVSGRAAVKLLPKEPGELCSTMEANK